MGEERRLLTVLFADLVGSTRLGSNSDPEVLRRLITRYFDRMKEVAVIHGGTVEKFIGDAVMVVFGVPQIHDDDAERAVRCGLAMQASLAEFNTELGQQLALRVGINTGEAVVQSGDDGQLIVGDPINVAARLQQGADPGEVVVGPLTARLTAAVVEYAPRPPTNAKGMPGPLESFHAMATRTPVPRQVMDVRRIRAPLVGRAHELSTVTQRFTETVSNRRSDLLTISGAAGIGKSRLVEEALHHIRAQAEPTVLRGRFLPYGRGITYWPLIEMLRDDAHMTLDDDREAAIAKLQNRIAALVGGTEATAVARRLAVMLGLAVADQLIPDVPPEQVAAEFAWAMRRYIEALAREKPLVIVIDDLQWAEPAAYELIDHVTLRAANVPVLWICLARPEFVEAHPRWATGRDNAAEIRLSPLTSADTSTLITQLLELEDIPAGLRHRLVERSGGNPLFCEEFLRMLIDDGRLVNDGVRWRTADGPEAIRIPETIQALLATRLDSLSNAEKQTLQAASIIGERFSDAEVARLRPSLDVRRAIDGLLQKGLVLQAPGSDDGELQFKHLLVRDVAYGTVAKVERAQLHDGFAALVETASRDRGEEFADIIAHHATQAFTLTVEMQLDDELIRSRAERTVSWNLVTAERARSRNDWRAVWDRVATAKSALTRVELEETDSRRLRLRLLEVDISSDRDDYQTALVLARQVVEQATSSRQWQIAAQAHLRMAHIGLRSNWIFLEGSEKGHAAEAAGLFRLAGDVTGELEAEWLEAFLSDVGTDPVESVERCRRIPERAADLRDYPRAASWMSLTAYMAEACGHPAARQITMAAVRWSELAGSAPSPPLISATAGIDALSGKTEQAVNRLTTAIEGSSSEGWDVITMQRRLAMILMNVGRVEDAAAVLDAAIPKSEATGERWHRSELFARRSVTAVRQGDLELGERCVTLAQESAKPGDHSAFGESHWALAELRAAQGRDAEAEAAYKAALIPGARELDQSPTGLDFKISFARFLVSRGRGADALPLLDSLEAWLRSNAFSLGLDEIARLRHTVQTGGGLP